jgi:hypothetical protein
MRSEKIIEMPKANGNDESQFTFKAILVCSRNADTHTHSLFYPHAIFEFAL